MARPHLAASGVVALVLAVLATPATATASVEQGDAQPLVVSSAGLSADVGPDGGIAGVRFADGRHWNLGGRSLLTQGVDGAPDACAPDGAATRTQDGGATWRTICSDAGGDTTTIRESLSPAPRSIAWTVRVESQGGTYAKGIWTKLSGWQDDHERKFWTAWGTGPHQGAGTPAWSDPLQPGPFVDRDLHYAGEVAGYADVPAGFSVPIATILEPDTDHGLSLVQSLDDVLIDAHIKTDASGDVELGRFDNRLAPGRAVTFHMNLVPTAADWRPALGWMVNRYRAYFDPTTPAVQDLAGLGTYSPFPGPFGDGLRAKLRAQDYRTNWELSLRGPYMGEFVPPVSSAKEQWNPFLHQFWPETPPKESIDGWRKILDYWDDAGLENLAYFNTTEFGANIEDPAPRQQYACDDPARWHSANDMLRCDFPNAVLRGDDGKPIFSWYDAVVMDPGDPAYRRHLLEQARKLLQGMPEYRGINIDRLDWLREFNTHADDGVTWYDGKPARSLITSWKELQPSLQALIHGMGKQVWVSPTGTNKRIDWLKGVDGILSEHDRGDGLMNFDAFLGLERPVIGWNHDTGGDPDIYIQRYLYMGVYPMSDAPVNDHGLPLSEKTEAYYRDYAPMFRALRGKRWVYAPHAVDVTSGNALANAFSVDGGVVVPVVQAGDAKQASIALRDLEHIKRGLDLTHAEYIQPGQTSWQPLAITREGDVVRADVPLARGAAMVRLRTRASGSVSTGDRPATLELQASRPSATRTDPAIVTATARNTTGRALTHVAAAIALPSGWSATRIDAAPGVIPPGASGTARWRVAPSEQISGTVGDVRATISYRQGGRDRTVSDARRLTAGRLLSQAAITATASSADSAYPVANALDGDEQTMWRSAADAPAPLAITLDLHGNHDLAGLTYLPQQDGGMNGVLSDYRIYVSSDGANYTEVGHGSWQFDAGLRAATFAATGVRYIRLEGNPGSCPFTAAAAEINVVLGDGGTPPADTSAGQSTASADQQFEHLVPQSQITATATSHHRGYEPSKALDANPYCTMWHAEYKPVAPLPQSITLDLGRDYNTIALLYQPRKDHSSNGDISRYEISTSLDGTSFTPVASGDWPVSPDPKYAEWSGTPARYVRLTAIDGYGGFASAGDINVAYEPSG